MSTQFLFTRNCLDAHGTLVFMNFRNPPFPSQTENIVRTKFGIGTLLEVSPLSQFDPIAKALALSPLLPSRALAQHRQFRVFFMFLFPFSPPPPLFSPRSPSKTPFRCWTVYGNLQLGENSRLSSSPFPSFYSLLFFTARIGVNLFWRLVCRAAHILCIPDRCL